MQLKAFDLHIIKRIVSLTVTTVSLMSFLKNISLLSRPVAASLLALTCASCVSAHLTHLDTEFDSRALRDGNIAILGVVTLGSAEEIDERQTASIVDNLGREITKRRPELSLKNQDQVGPLLEKAGLDLSSDTFPVTTLEPFKEEAINYGIVVAVTFNSVDRFVTNHTDVRNVYYENKKITGRDVKYFTIAQTKRSTTAEYRIYDLTTGERVWASESSNSRSRKRSAEDRNGYPPAPDFAPAQSTSHVIRPMTTAVVKELPAMDIEEKEEADQ